VFILAHCGIIPLRVEAAATLPGALALIFDLDGVIVDSNPVHVEVWGEYLGQFGIEIPADLPERMYGLRNDQLVGTLMGGDYTAEEIFEHGAAKEELYRRRMHPQLARRLVPGIGRFLERHAGWPMAVASNAEPANVEFILRESGLSRHFSVIVDGHQVAMPKPDPEIYFLAARLLGKAPSECAVFEDSSAGVAAAKAAGCRVVALRTTHASLPEADLIVDDFLSPELEPWLGQQLLSH
jgi:HAD superfamily hydrolase (TIGR01509 family)